MALDLTDEEAQQWEALARLAPAFEDAPAVEHPMLLDARPAGPAYGDPGRSRSALPTEAPRDLAQLLAQQGASLEPGPMASEPHIEGAPLADPEAIRDRRPDRPSGQPVGPDALQLLGQRLAKRGAAPPTEAPAAYTMPVGRSSAPQMAPADEPAPRPIPEGPNGTMVALALLGDMLVNKGRGADRILKMYGMDKSPLDREMQRAQIERMRQGPSPRIADPLSQELKRAQIDDVRARTRLRGEPNAAEQRLLEAEQRRAEVNAMMFDPEHPTAVNFRQYLYEQGYPEGSLDQLNYDQLKSLRTVTIAPELELQRTPRTAQSEAKIAGARRAATESVGFRYDKKRADLGEQYTERREERGSRRRLAGTARDLELEFTQADSRLDAFERKVDELIARKGADYTIPIRGNVIRRFYTTADKTVLGGSGMDTADTDLVISGKNLGLGQYTGIAGNTPNTLVEQESSFDNVFQTGRLVDIKRRLQTMRREGREAFDRQLEVLRRPGPDTGGAGRGGGGGAALDSKIDSILGGGQ